MNTNKNLFRWIILGLLATCLIAAGLLTLTDPEIVHSHIGAGGSSSGGIYALSGSVGQHDAGASMSGGEFSLDGGVWSGAGSSEMRICLPFITR